MIITSIQAGGREAVLEYSTGASWLSWGYATEGEWDTHIFLGKFSLVYTNLKQKPYKLATVTASLIVFLAAACGVADAMGFSFDNLRANGPR